MAAVPRSPITRVRLGARGDHTLGNILERLAAVHGDALLVTEAGQPSCSYRGAAAKVDRWAGALHPRIRAGERVVLATPNGYDQVLLCLAVCRAGGIAVPVNPQMRDEEVDHVIADAQASVVVRSAGDLGSADPLGWSAHSDPAEVAALFYTSGTTGKPKGVSLTHRGLLGRLPRAMTVPLEVLGPGEAVMALPVAHIMGFAAALGFACAGVPVYSMDRFRPVEVLDAIEHRRASMFIGVPAMYRMLIDAGAEQRNLRSVQVWMSGADAMPADLARRFQRMGSSITLPIVGGVGQALFVEGYGMAELSGAAAGKVLPPYVSRWFAADGLGIPLPGYKFKILGDDDKPAGLGQVGELWVKGPGVTTGYWGDAAATNATRTAGGWLRTGDLVRRGAFGTFRFAGRAKDVVKHGGYSVYTVEVQHLLEQHPAVLEAAVVGIPDERTGELVAAAVHLRTGEAATAEELIAFCHEHLARYKCPQRVAFVDALPRTGSNKVQRQALRELFETD